MYYGLELYKKGPICCSKELLKNSKTAQTLKGPRSGILVCYLPTVFFNYNSLLFPIYHSHSYLDSHDRFWLFSCCMPHICRQTSAAKSNRIHNTVAVVSIYLEQWFFITFFQVVGSAVLCIGVWMAVDKTSFIHLTKFGSIEGMEVNYFYFIFHFLMLFFCHKWMINVL